MREISQATQEILKSQKMLGVNKFNYELKLDGVEYFSDIKDSINIRLSDGAYGDFVVRADGKILVTFQNNGYIYLSVVANEDDLLSIPNLSLQDAWQFAQVGDTTTETRASSLLRLKNGKILLFILDRKNDYNIKVYTSNNGLGTDFAGAEILLYTSDLIDTIGSWYANSVGKAKQLKNGRVLLPVLSVEKSNQYKHPRSDIIYTDDLINWHIKNIIKGVYAGDVFNGIAVHENGNLSFVIGSNVGTGRAYIYKSTDNGNNWAYIGNLSTSTSYLVFSSLFSGEDGYIYFLAQSSINSGIMYRKRSEIAPNDLGYYMFENWEEIGVFSGQFRRGYLFFVTPKGNIIAVGHNWENGISSNINGYIREVYSEPIKAQSISISKGKGGANSLSLSVDNSNGAINPKNPESPLYGIINLNKQIIVKQGYGSDLIETFTGLIDSFSMKSWPHTMEISCRDHLKKALDQTITEAGSHTVNFESQAIESIFGYLCYLGGIETGEIDTTGISISKEFSWQTYADAFQFLADLASFDYGADEYGKIYFKRDYQPDEISIAYTFEEGIDITSLSYQLEDKDLYSTVKVYGKSGDNVISYTALFPDAAKYNILPQKILKVDATEASTMTELRMIADRSIYLMNSRTAVVNFAAVAVPWLQVGDFIQVNESSSMSAGIYRISSLNLKMTDKDFTMDLQCYYYGDSVDVGNLPEDTATQTGNASLNLIPEMTSNVAPSGVARASSVLTLYDNDYGPWNALNSTSDDLYWNAVSQYGWIEYTFTKKTIIDKYMLKARQAIDYNKAMPKNWQFEGFDGDKWIVLDTRSNQTDWQIHEMRSFDFTNTKACAKYRLNVSANNGFKRLQLEQLAMYYRGGA